jgi:hypothetical protein
LQLKKSVNKLQVNNRSVLREAYETYWHSVSGNKKI